MKLSLKEKEYIYKKLWETKLKNELCKNKTLIQQIAKTSAVILK